MSHSTLQLGSLYLLYAKVGHVDSVEFLELQTFEYVFFGNVINDRIKDRDIDTSVGTLDISLGTLRNCIHAFVDRNKMYLLLTEIYTYKKL